GVLSYGIEAHPFVCRVARAKLGRRTDPEVYRLLIEKIIHSAARRVGRVETYPPLLRRCYDNASLEQLDTLKRAVLDKHDGSPASELAWLTLVAILRRVSHAGTAPWQYILPRKTKKRPSSAFTAFNDLAQIIHDDMVIGQNVSGPAARLIQGDART